jgi:hypothetical protein
MATGIHQDMRDEKHPTAGAGWRTNLPAQEWACFRGKSEGGKIGALSLSRSAGFAQNDSEPPFGKLPRRRKTKPNHDQTHFLQ